MGLICSRQQVLKYMRDLVKEHGSDGDICNEMWAGVKYGYLLASLTADVEESLSQALETPFTPPGSKQ